jgi:AcrR family transcriptional regulator
MIEPFQAESPAEQAKRRTAHLVSVVAHIIVHNGVAHVTHARVAELAGCARALVYRRFPTREDLVYSVLAVSHANVALRYPPEAAEQNARSFAGGQPDHAFDDDAAFFDAIWPKEDWTHEKLELHLASCIVIKDASLHSVIGAHVAELEQGLDNGVRIPLRRLGLTPVEIDVTTDVFLAAQYRVARAAWAGELTRDEARHLLVAACSAIVRGLVSSAP